MNWIIMLFTYTGLLGGNISAPTQPIVGPGGADYQYDDFLTFDCSDQSDGYWLYVPTHFKSTEAEVVVFLHGYGSINPMAYGGWLRHLLRKGNIIIYPRYQKNLLSPSPDVFASNTATAIQDAIEQLKNELHFQPKLENFTLVGHSYGGVIAANIGVNYESLDLPQPKAMMLCSPGSGPFNGGVLESYAGMPQDLKLLIMVSMNDYVVGEKIGQRVFVTADQVKERNYVRQFPDNHGQPTVTAGHNESYSIDYAFDTGLRNITARRAVHISKHGPVDYFGYWKLLDALLAYQRTGKYAEVAFGGGAAQRFMGNWSDGTVVRPLEVYLPRDIK